MGQINEHLSDTQTCKAGLDQTRPSVTSTNPPQSTCQLSAGVSHNRYQLHMLNWLRLSQCSVHISRKCSLTSSSASSSPLSACVHSFLTFLTLSLTVFTCKRACQSQNIKPPRLMQASAWCVPARGILPDQQLAHRLGVKVRVIVL